MKLRQPTGNYAHKHKKMKDELKDELKEKLRAKIAEVNNKILF